MTRVLGGEGLGWLSLNRRPSPKTSLLPSPIMHTDEYATPSPIAAQPQSFGNDFNLIRAVEEYGPQRVESIRKELEQIDARKNTLAKEMYTLEKLIAATKPSNLTEQNMAIMMSGVAYPDAHTTFTERTQKAYNSVASPLEHATRATDDYYAGTILGKGFDID